MNNTTNLHNNPLLEQWCFRFDSMLSDTLSYKWKDLHPYWQERLLYSVRRGGKRIRPLMIYAIGKAYHLGPGFMDPIASAVEIIHTYSLIHDDLPAMDDDAFRRGYPSAHKAFNEADAILIGDGLLADAFHVLSAACVINPLRRLKLIEQLALASGASFLVYGQWMDLYQNIDSYETLCNLHHKKTGALFSFCLLAGAIVAGRDNDLPLLGQIGKDIGLAFQIQDDLLDLLPMSCTGKSSGKDEKHGKKTVLSFFSASRAKKLSEDLYSSSIESLQKMFPDTAKDAIDLINLLQYREI